ncbi:MAG: PIN domain-containing protein [Aureibaculum sp.]|nr:PIN domain-containing protein [Aureibaculum sp.]
MVFLDSCIVIDYINGRLDISDGDKKNFCINSIVDMEICIGARNKRELNSINKKISEFMSIDIDQGIMNLSVQIINEYNLSHDMTIYDAVIAATCMVYDLPLWTHNKKDFKFLDVSLE